MSKKEKKPARTAKTAVVAVARPRVLLMGPTGKCRMVDEDGEA